MEHIKHNVTILLLSIIFYSLLFSSLSCSKHDNPKFPNVGDQIPDSAIDYHKAFKYPQYQDSTRIYTYSFSGLKFYLEVSADRKIVSIFTADSNFVTPEGVKIGDNGIKVLKIGKTTSNGLNMCEYELPSKWRVVLKKDSSSKSGLTKLYSYDPEKMKVITIRKYNE
ncbi:MAG: hypothetical protein ABSA44_08115 [Bacteroidota bacterium]